MGSGPGGWVGCLAVQVGGLELGQGLGAAFDRGAGLAAVGGGEVVPGGDLGQPGAEPFQVGLGLLDLGVGGAATGALVCQFAFELGEAFQQPGVLGVTGRLEVVRWTRLRCGQPRRPKHPSPPGGPPGGLVGVATGAPAAARWRPEGLSGPA